MYNEQVFNNIQPHGWREVTSTELAKALSPVAFSSVPQWLLDIP